MKDSNGEPDTPAAILRAARELLSSPRRWGKGTYSKSGRYCSLGACAKVATDGSPESISSWPFGRLGWKVDGILSEAFMRLHEAGEITVNEQQASNTLGMRFSDLLEVPASAAFWNDLLTYRDVVKAFDLAIEIAEGDHVGS